MNEPTLSPPRRLLRAVRTVLWSGRDAPGGAMPGAETAGVVGAMIVLGVLTVGLSAGSIAILIEASNVPGNYAWLFGLLMAGPLAAAVRWPLAAWRMSALGFLICLLVVRGTGFWPWPVTSFLALLVLLFVVATAGPRRFTLGVGTVTVALLWGGTVFGMEPWFAAILSAVALLALAFGDAVGGRHVLAEVVAQQNELRRQDLARQAVLEERARIARELHDVVAHHMSVIAMQAEAAPYKIPDLPDGARDTFVVLRDAAREALTETRRVVGLLRSDDEGAERAPQPGLDRLEELVAAARDGGLEAAVTVVGVPRPLATGTDLSAFRIAQEALSNARRYAPGATVAVEVRYGAAGITITVTDDGAKRTPEESHGGGHGLVGMRERVTMLGGVLEAGPENGGWRVRAELPYDRSA